MADHGGIHPLVDAQTKQDIVAAYQRGDKIRDIEERHGIARATVYWVLEQAKVSPDRVKRGPRLSGNDQALAQLYDLITAQDQRIQQLEQFIRDSGMRVP